MASVASVVAALQAFEPAQDRTETLDRLYTLLRGFRDLPGREVAAPAMFGVMERHPTADLGSPGPLVHELEAIPGYESELRRSVQRRPALLTLWMINRILNATAGATEREPWLALLRAVHDEQNASSALREEAAFFLEHQGEGLGPSGPVDR